MSSTLGFNISYLEYVPALQIKIYNMQYIQRKENVNIKKNHTNFTHLINWLDSLK